MKRDGIEVRQNRNEKRVVKVGRLTGEGLDEGVNG